MRIWGWIAALALSAQAGWARAAEPRVGAADAAGGKKLFAAKCATCHGKDAKGNASMAKMFKLEPAALDLTAEAAQKSAVEELSKIITGGRKKMPSFKGKLKDSEIGDIVAFIRSLGAGEKALPKAEGKPAKKK